VLRSEDFFFVQFNKIVYVLGEVNFCKKYKIGLFCFEKTENPINFYHRKAYLKMFIVQLLFSWLLIKQANGEGKH
jgi:hypothetical protein